MSPPATQIMDQAPATFEPLLVFSSKTDGGAGVQRQVSLAAGHTSKPRHQPFTDPHSSDINQCHDRQQQQQLDDDQTDSLDSNDGGLTISSSSSGGGSKSPSIMSSLSSSPPASIQQQQEGEQIKCSAVHSLERDMPDFDYSHLVDELRDRVLRECQLNSEGLYAHKDMEKCKHDPWFVERFLLRQKLDIDKALDMMKRTMRFRNESMAARLRPVDFPSEFYQVGGLFGYEPDRKANLMLYIRLKIHRKISELNMVLQAFLYHNIDHLDELANGKGIAIVLDCTGAGLANADMDMLMFLISTLVNYFPKGMSYLLVHELPWILKPFWHIAKAWLAEEHRELIKFSNSRTIYEYVKRENLPDFMGGTCQRNYKQPPEDCTTLEQACKEYGVEKEVAKRILLKFAQYLPAETVAKATADDDGLVVPSASRDRDLNNGQDS